MRPNDYYGHYKAFVKDLSNNPDLTLQEYCKREEVVWRRLYDWMHRHKISLRRLYDACRDGKETTTQIKNEILPEFREIRPQREERPICTTHHPDPSVVSMSRILLPGGAVIELKDCPVGALSVLLGQCMGKEVADVQP